MKIIKNIDIIKINKNIYDDFFKNQTDRDFYERFYEDILNKYTDIKVIKITDYSITFQGKINDEYYNIRFYKGNITEKKTDKIDTKEYKTLYLNEYEDFGLMLSDDINK